jgi:hypothetical protein
MNMDMDTDKDMDMDRIWTGYGQDMDRKWTGTWRSLSLIPRIGISAVVSAEGLDFPLWLSPWE